jgi:hypothetical protein
MATSEAVPPGIVSSAAVPSSREIMGWRAEPRTSIPDPARHSPGMAWGDSGALENRTRTRSRFGTLYPARTPSAWVVVRQRQESGVGIWCATRHPSWCLGPALVVNHFAGAPPESTTGNRGATLAHGGGSARGEARRNGGTSCQTNTRRKSPIYPNLPRRRTEKPRMRGAQASRFPVVLPAATLVS